MPFMARRANRGFGFPTIIRPGVVRPGVIRSGVCNAAAIVGLVVWIVKTAFILEDNIVGRAVTGIDHRLIDLLEEKRG